MRRLLLFALLSLPLLGQGQPQDYVWTSQSRDSSESMPLGGGDLGLNVWVEGDELLFYVCRSGSYDEHNTLLKAGRVRLKIEGGEAAAPFRQTLRLADGSMRVELLGATVTLRVDVFEPVVRVVVESPRAVTCEVSYENWRHRDRPYRSGEGRQSSHKWAKTAGLATTADTVCATEHAVTFCHRNPARTLFDRTVEVEGLAAVRDSLWNPLAHRISGGRLWSRDLRFAGESEGRYLDTDFRAWRFRSVKPSKRHAFALALATMQSADLAPWTAEVERTVARAEADPKGDVRRTEAWWRAYWQRSRIEADGPAADIARNYTLFRYMLGCNRRGADPTKFNGGLFTFDPQGVDTAQRFTPDFRNWGGGTMTAQNQRLVYWPMLRSGDFDLMPVQFDYASDFSQGLALVGIGKRDVRKFGFIDLSGQAAIPIEYDNAELTKEGLLKVMRKEGIAEQWGYLSRDGEVAVPLEYGQLMKPAEGFIAAAKGTWTEGETAMSSPKFKGKYGFLDYEGNVLIPFDFVDAHSFQNGVAAVAVEGKYYPKWGFIDTCGKTVVPFRYYEVRNFREGLALVGRVIDGEVRYGFISPDGEEVIAAQYASAREFRDGYALVSEFSKGDFAPFYLIDRAGNRRLPYALYDVNDSGRYGHMTAAVPDSTGLLRYGLIDKRGRQIIPFQYDRITIFSEWDAQTQSWKEAGIAEVNGMERSFNIFRNSKK